MATLPYFMANPTAGYDIYNPQSNLGGALASAPNTYGTNPTPNTGGTLNPYFRDYQAPGAQQGNVTYQTMPGIQGDVQKSLEEARWKRVMDFFNQSGIMQGVMGGVQGGAFAGQTASLKAAPAIRNYQNVQRDTSNNMASRGMGLSTANERTQGENYGNLSRSLTEAGTYGDVAQKQLGFNLLAELLRVGGRA